MRLTDNEISAITEVFRATFGHGSVYLFGSRTDDSMRGGDIDLYLKPLERSALSEKQVGFLVHLKRKIGDQKIDIVIEREPNTPLGEIVKRDGILLCSA